MDSILRQCLDSRFFPRLRLRLLNCWDPRSKTWKRETQAEGETRKGILETQKISHNAPFHLSLLFMDAQRDSGNAKNKPTTHRFIYQYCSWTSSLHSRWKNAPFKLKNWSCASCSFLLERTVERNEAVLSTNTHRLIKKLVLRVLFIFA